MFAFLGRPNLALNPESPAFPLTHNSWLEALGDASVEYCSDEKLLQDARMWESVTTYTGMIFRNFLMNIEESEHNEAMRLKLKTENSSFAMANALAAFRAIIEPTSEPLCLRSDDNLLAACQIIGARLLINFTAPSASGGAHNDPALNIAQASSVRVRSVALAGKWWVRDNGAMLAFYGKEKSPVALLPVHDKRYILQDPHTGASLPLTDDVANKLAPFAYVFYRTFEPIALSILDLLKFGGVGLKRDALMVGTIGIAIGLIGMVVPILTGKLFDSVIPSADHSELWQAIAILIPVAIASSAFELARSVAMLRIEGKMDAGLQAAVWDRVLNLPISFFKEYNAGDLVMRINGISAIRKALSGEAVAVILSGIFSSFSFVVLFYYNVKMALFALVLIAFASAVIVALGYLKLRYDRQWSAAQGRISGMVMQYLGGIAKLRVSGAESRVFANWAKEFALQEKLSFKSGSVDNAAETFFSILPIITSMIFFVMVADLMQKQQGNIMTTGEFIAFSSAFSSFLVAIVRLGGTLLSSLNIVSTYERVKPILQTCPEMNQSNVDPGKLTGEIEVQNVSFSYSPDGEMILNEISFSITQGEFVAIVGPSGSGKSTLIRQLLGFEKPSSGSICYDGKDLAGLDLHAVRRQFGVVLQNGRLMNGDIFTNIVGASRLTHDDAWEAARLCGLEGEINAMPMKMFTVVSEGSSTLSGGQRQRILIARAIAHQPRILLFDEATSALDNRTEAIVSKSLEQLAVTRIVIAHRLSTIINADRILVLDGGKIVQQGQYEELVNINGPFLDLAQRQLAFS